MWRAGANRRSPPDGGPAPSAQRGGPARTGVRRRGPAPSHRRRATPRRSAGSSATLAGRDARSRPAGAHRAAPTRRGVAAPPAARAAAGGSCRGGRRSGVPVSTARRTAQRGSLSCPQSRNRHAAASSRMSSNASSSALVSSHSWSSRMPGVSMIRPPSGRTISSRCVVVCRPRPSRRRTCAVRCRSRPSRRLMMVDLPTPEEPIRAPVRPGGRCCRRGVGPAGAQRLDDVQGGLGGEGRGGLAPGREVGAPVRLVEHEHRGGAAVADGDQIPFDSPGVEVVVEAAHHEHRVDVGGDELPAGRFTRRLAGETQAARQHRLDGRRVPVGAGANRDPVADHRAGGLRRTSGAEGDRRARP